MPDDSPLRILLVEDNPDDAALMERHLRRELGTVETRRVETEAELAAALAETAWDLMLVDYTLPAYSGPAAIALGRQRDPDLPAIVVSGTITDEMAGELMRIGASDFLLKDRLGRLGLAARMALNAARLQREERAALEALAASERRLKAAEQLVHLGHWTWEIAEDRFTTSDEQYRLVGLEPQSAEGGLETVLGFADPSDRPAVRAAFERAARDGTPTRLEVHVTRADGRPVIFETQITAEPAPDGTIRRIVGTNLDITDWRNDQERLQRSEAELRGANVQLSRAMAELEATHQQTVRQERLRALGEMASGIVHDFNNALAPIMGYAELLLMRPETWSDRELVTRYLNLIVTGASDAANVMRRLREFYRPPDETMKLQPVDLGTLVEQVVALTQPRWKDQALLDGRAIRVQTSLESAPTITGDEAELREALTNLVFNAVDAMPQGGTITIRATPDERGGAILEVSDTGTGMTDETRARCLEPFFSTKGERGTGLGLPMVYGIVTRHGGHVEIESAPGRGTTVRLTLPPTTPAAAPDLTPRIGRALTGLRVLVIDDEQAVRDVLRMYLEQDGHTVETAENGRDGLDRFRAGRFDVVVTDRAMPGLIGDQVAAAIKQEAPATPVILVTGFGDLMAAAGEAPAGVDRILGKPVRASSLRAAISAVVGAGASAPEGNPP